MRAAFEHSQPDELVGDAASTSAAGSAETPVASLHSNGVAKELGAVGLCAPTEFGQSDCNLGEQGAWELRGPAAQLSSCVRLCSCCANCHYVSFSARHGDCSWYRTCDIQQLQV